MSQKLDEFIIKLSSTVTADNLFNPYNEIWKAYDINTAPGLRQGNLRVYLEKHLSLNTPTLLLFESPDNHNSSLTGIPLVSLDIFSKVETILGLTMHLENATKKRSDYGTKKLDESVWDRMSKSKKLAIFWYLLPFYPYNGKDIAIKRAPSKDELLKYSEFLHSLIEIYNPKKILVVGNVTKSILDSLKVKAISVSYEDVTSGKAFLKD